MTNRLLRTGVRVALLAAAVGLVACSSSDSASVVSSVGNSRATTAASTTGAPTTTAAEPSTTAESSTTSATPTTTSATPTTTSATATTGSATPTTTGAPTTSDAPTSTSGAPVPAQNVYLAFTDTGNVTARSGDQVLGEAGCGECQVTAAAYRDGVMWIAAFTGGAEVTRHDLATGATTTVYRADPGVQIEDIAVWDSSVWIVTSQDSAQGSAYALIAVDAGGIRQVDGGVVGVAASADGRYLAYSTCGVCQASGARGYAGSVVVVADLTSGAKREIAAPAGNDRNYYIAPDPLSWTSDGTLLIDETWEGSRTSILAFDAASQADAVALSQRSSDPNDFAPAEATCFVDAEHVAVARWSHPYADGEPTPGPIVVRSLTSPDETPYGAASVIGTSMACDADSAVVVATDDGRLVRITPDGATAELGIGYAMVSAG